MESTATDMRAGRPQGLAALWAAAAGGLLASACCLGPLVLLLLGISGAWISHLTALEPLRPFFLAGATVALVLAGRRIWRPQAVCAPGAVCAQPRVRWGRRLVFLLVAMLVLIGLLFPFVAPWFY